MEIEDAQREVRSVYIGGFWGQLVSAVIWLVSAALGTWVTPKASILAVVIAGFFIFPLTQMLLRLSGAPWRARKLPHLRLGNSPGRRWEVSSVGREAIRPKQDRSSFVGPVVGSFPHERAAHCSD